MSYLDIFPDPLLSMISQYCNETIKFDSRVNYYLNDFIIIQKLKLPVDMWSLYVLFISAAERNDLFLIQLMCQYFNIHKSSDYSYLIPLQIACMNGFVDLCQYLLQLPKKEEKLDDRQYIMCYYYHKILSESQQSENNEKCIDLLLAEPEINPDQVVQYMIDHDKINKWVVNKMNLIFNSPAYSTLHQKINNKQLLNAQHLLIDSIHDIHPKKLRKLFILSIQNEFYGTSNFLFQELIKYFNHRHLVRIIKQCLRKKEKNIINKITIPM